MLNFLPGWKGFSRPVFLWVTLGAHASCVLGVRHSGHAGSVRSQGRNLRVLRVSAVRFFWLRLGCTMKISAPLAIRRGAPTSTWAPATRAATQGRPYNGPAPLRPFSLAV